MARKTSFKPEMEIQAEKMSTRGATDKQLGKAFGVTEQTINNWKQQFPSFFESLKRGKDIADAKVELALYQRALGYVCPDVDIRVIDGKVVKTATMKQYPPDTAAAFIWLKNRKPDQWRDQVFVDDSRDDPEQVNASRSTVRDRFKRLETTYGDYGRG